MKQYFLILLLLHAALAAPNEATHEEAAGDGEIAVESAQMMGMGMNPMMGMGMNPMMGMGMNPMMMRGGCGGCSCGGCSIPWMCLPVCVSPCCCNGGSNCNDETTTTDAPAQDPDFPQFPWPDMHGPEDGTPIWQLPERDLPRLPQRDQPRLPDRNVPRPPQRDLPRLPERNVPHYVPEGRYPPDIIVRW